MNTTTLQKDQVREQVRERYGAIADNAGERGCCGDSCCGGVLENGTDATVLGYTAGDVSSVPEGAEMGLGCGNPTAIASIQPGETIVDLGSGGGFDCFLAARQTGSAGKVIGVDMTPSMVSKARANAAKGDFDNVDFRLGEIENLPITDNTADLIISNCVINLSPDKRRVFAEAWRILKKGGRIALSDIVALKPLPQDLKGDLAAYTGCVAGASLVDEYRQMLAAAGFQQVAVEIKQGSQEYIDEWIPGQQAGQYVASANITARK